MQGRHVSRRACTIVKLGLLAALVGLMLAVPASGRFDVSGSPAEAALRAQAHAVEDLSRILGPSTSAPRAGGGPRRSALRIEKARAAQLGNAQDVARANAALAGEAVARSRLLLERWSERVDPKTGLLPTSMIDADGNRWAYGDTGSDLFPHLTIAASLIAPEFYPRFEGIMAAERARGPGLPRDVDLGTGRTIDQTLDERIFGAAEYAKDGLLPLLDQVGPDPWLGRLREIADAVLDASATPTRRQGRLPADSTEVNGDMLQVLARLYWATDNAEYLDAAGRIGATYLEDVLPTTTFLPPNRWNFAENEPIERRRFRLSDHGNEVLSGLIEWHLAETLRGSPSAPAHREPIRRMLGRLLDRARTQDGLWLRVIEIPSGRVEQEGVTDSWGYVFQAFLTQAIVEDQAPDGRPNLAAEYREAARRAVRALPHYRYYGWEQGKMDGYADALEGAIYMLHELRDPIAEEWLDDQMAVLYGFQDDSGAVLDYDLDGNFVRTSLLYGLRLTRGARLDPWPVGGLLGAAEDDRGCLVLASASREPWTGRLALDRPRHRLYGNLPIDYPRLNKWPEWFVAEPGATYEVGVNVGGTSGSFRTVNGTDLAAGVELSLRPGEETTVRVCPSGN